MKRKIKIIYSISILFLSLLMLNVNAQEQNISLDQALELGLKNSPYLKIDEGKVQSAIAGLEKAKEGMLPDFKISGSYMWLTNANVNMQLGKSTQTQSSQPSSSPESSSNSVMPSTHQLVYGMANASLPIYAGGRIRYGIDAAQCLLNAARFTAENNSKDIVLNIINAYGSLYKVQQLIKVLQENLVASKSRDSVLFNMENNGLLARNDRLKAALQTSNIELQLLEAVTNKNIANASMNILLGLPQDTQNKVDDKFIVHQELEALSYYQEAANQYRSDIKAIDQQKNANLISEKIAKAEVLPTVALTGGYIAADIHNILTVTNAINLGLGIQYNLSSLWKKNTALKDAQAKTIQLNANKDILTDAIQLSVRKDYENVLLSERKIAVYKKAIQQAEENYRITKNKFDNSLVTTTDLLDANALLLMSKINLANANADATLAYEKLLTTSGIILK